MANPEGAKSLKNKNLLKKSTILRWRENIFTNLQAISLQKKSLQYEPFDDIHSPIDARLGMQYIQGRNVVYGRKEGFIKGRAVLHLVQMRQH